MYRLSTKYDETGKITPSDLNLENSNRLEEVVNQFIVKEINQKLKEDSKQVYHIISIYRYSIFIIVLLYTLGALLIIFGKYWASIPIIIATGDRLAFYGILVRKLRLPFKQFIKGSLLIFHQEFG